MGVRSGACIALMLLLLMMLVLHYSAKARSPTLSVKACEVWMGKDGRWS